MKIKSAISNLILLISVFSHAQNLDSVRQIINSMDFDVPVLSPVPFSVYGVRDPVLSLNGTWEFNPNSQVPNEFKKIEVPGEWEMQGFKVEKGKSALYRKDFNIPDDWEGNCIKIRFDGISSCGKIKINGTEVGSHEGSFAAFEFDITGVAKPGKNFLEVEVQCGTISDILACTSQYAAHPVGGILRKVTLFTLPETNISDFTWNVKFDSQYLDAILTINAGIISDKPISMDTRLQFKLMDSDNQPVIPERYRFEVPAGENSGEASCILKIKSPEKWDPEHPNLYILVTSLVSDGRVLQVNRHKIGFRQVELRGNRLFVNNHPVKLRGVNRHEVHPLLGRSLTHELCRRDAELFREGNCNYIRTSHYPPSEEFLQACDELGLFVESEASLCWIQHGASPIWKEWNYLDTKYLTYMLRANYDNVLSGCQHPCVIIWSLGNESRWSPLWEKVNTEVKKLDPSRPTAFHDQCWGNFNNAGSRADIANYHYPNFNGPRECEKEKDRPTLFGEYMHVQCYARRELETDPGVRSDTWATTLRQMVDSVYSYSACLGGAIWSGIDDIFHLSEDKICGYGPWGPIDGWRRLKPEYTGMKKSYSPVKITNLRNIEPANGIIKLDLENRYNFTNLNELKITVKTGNQSIPFMADIAPLSKGSVTLDLSGAKYQDALLITFTDPRGFICHEEVITPGKVPVSIPAKIMVHPELSEDKTSYTIRSGKITYKINKNDGTLGCIFPNNGQVITQGGEIMMIPVNNDDGGASGIAGNNYTQDIQPLDYSPSEKLKINSLVAENRADGKVHITLSGEIENQFQGSREYIFNDDGLVDFSYDYTALTDFKGKNLLRQFGLLFTLPVSFDLLSWERKGLWTVYPDNDISRLKGFARALPKSLNYVEEPRKIPAGEWKDNSNRLGTNDFRSTKDLINMASLKNDEGVEVIIHSDGSQSVRAWIDGDKTRFFVTGMNGPGSCHFFTGLRPEIRKGDHLTGKFNLSIIQNR